MMLELYLIITTSWMKRKCYLEALLNLLMLTKARLELNLDITSKSVDGAD